MNRGEIASFATRADQTRTILSNSGHFLYFISLFILNNPFVFIETEIRFGLFIFALTAGTALIYISEAPKRTIPHIAAVVLLVLYGVAALRINAVGSAGGTGGASEQSQTIVTAYCIASSYFISTRLDFYKMNISILIISSLCFAPILFNANDLFDYYQKDSFSLGVLTYDSYQAASQIVGFFAISMSAFMLRTRRSIPFYAISFVIIALALYAVTLSPARGEAIALAASIFILFTSRSKAGYVVIIIFVLFITSQNFVETTLGSRLSTITSGDLGERDILFNMGLKQFTNDLYTLVLGLGFNGFQIYNNLPLELYPHNFLLEGAISGGMPFLAILIYIYIVPIIKILLTTNRSPEQSLSLSIMLFLVMINLKSGTLVSFWGLGAYTAVFLAVAGLRSPR